MAVAFVNSTTVNSTGTTVSFSYTSGSGSDREMLAASIRAGGGDVSGVTYAAASLTNVASTGTLRIWSKTAPATGANTAAFTLSSYGRLLASVTDWTGVDQTTPTGTAVTGSGTSTAASTGSITCPTDGAVFGTMYSSYAGGSAPTAGSGTTLIGGVRTAGGGQLFGTGRRADTGAIVFSHNSCTWSAVGVPINAAGGASSFVPAWARNANTVLVGGRL